MQASEMKEILKDLNNFNISFTDLNNFDLSRKAREDAIKQRNENPEIGIYTEIAEIMSDLNNFRISFQDINHFNFRRSSREFPILKTRKKEPINIKEEYASCRRKGLNCAASVKTLIIFNIDPSELISLLNHSVIKEDKYTGFIFNDKSQINKIQKGKGFAWVVNQEHLGEKKRRNRESVFQMTR